MFFFLDFGLGDDFNLTKKKKKKKKPFDMNDVEDALPVSYSLIQFCVTLNNQFESMANITVTTNTTT